jgi:pantoate ligase/cytidylate kinase
VRLFTTIAGIRSYLELKRSPQQLPERGEISHAFYPPQIGFVPTMGALHAGHLSLVQRARQESDLVVVSIFVNPLQFGPNEDFHRYPRTLEQDEQLCRSAGVDVIFAPSALELYGTSYAPLAETVTQVMPPATMIAGLCGQFRPGHFPGVTTVVTKLFNIVQPDRAYFGQKDAQQVALIRRMVADLNFPVTVVTCPIVREPDGLALSSRNRYLSPGERAVAPTLYHSLQRAESAFSKGRCDRTELLSLVKAELAKAPDIQPEYIELVHPDTMTPLEQVEEIGLVAIAARLGSTRLIDNMVLRNRQPIVAIDGPAGAGKSTVVRQVAQVLGLLYLDTGAMYRAVTWLVLKSGIAITDEASIAELVSQCEIRLESQDAATRTQEEAESLAGSPIPRVLINGQDVTQAIRTLEVTAQVSAIAAQPFVRQELVKRQQAYGRQGGVVMEGRDIGTHVFPDAELKIFLTASVQERARRRQQDLKNQGRDISLDELERSIEERDRKDRTRRLAPLRKAADAIEINTDHLTIEEVTANIVSLYHEKLVSLQRVEVNA